MSLAQTTTQSVTKAGRQPIALVMTAFLLASMYIGLRFPGELNPDSLSQYHQAITGEYNDWHPPIMARLWSVFRLIADGTWTMFVFHALSYWLALLTCALSLSFRGYPRLAWTVLALGLFPPFLMLGVNIHKDVGLAVLLLLAFSITFLARSSGHESWLIKVFVSVLLFYVVMVRVNGLFAALPIIIYAWRPTLLAKPLSLALLSVLMTLLLLPLETLINRTVFQARPAGAIRSLQVFDLAGIAHFAQDARLIGEADADSHRFETCYTPVLADPLYHGSRCGFIWDQLAVGEDGRQSPNPNLNALWIRTILTHPLAYARHRLVHMNSELAFAVPSHSSDLTVINRIVSGNNGAAEIHPARSWLLDLARNNVFSAPAFWLCLASCIVIFGLPFRADDVALSQAAVALALAATIYIAAYGLVGVATDPRYQFPGMLGAGVATILAIPVIRTRFREPRSRDIAAVAVLVVTVAIILACRVILPDALTG